MHDAGRCGLVKQRRLVFVQLAKDCPHECLADEAALVLDAVLRAETIQHLLLAGVQENGDSIFARGLHQGLEIKSELGAEGKEVPSCFSLEAGSLYGLCSNYLRLLKLSIEDCADRGLGIELAPIT